MSADQKFKLGIFGRGKLAQAIAEVLKRPGFEDWELLFMLGRDQHVDQKLLVECDAWIEISHATAVLSRVELAIELGKPLVIGTTGWLDNRDLIISLQKANPESALLYAPNFSLGVNVFMALNQILARWLSAHPQYAASMKEWHHIHKADAPSGTAIALAEQILAENKRHSEWKLKSSASPVRDLELGVEAFREGEIKGIHQIDWKSEIDQIQIRHEAHNRDGFALGAIHAARWIVGKKGFFHMQDAYELSDLQAHKP